jgi:glycosyltransferase involved in cell wall biosynthesis
MKDRIALVVQRYGQEVNGGAELLCRQVAEHLAPLYDVEVLTTCAIDHVTWRNEYPSGLSTLHGVTIRRFPVDYERNPHFFHRLSFLTYDSGRIKGPRRIFQKFIEQRWMRSQGPFSSELFRYLGQHKADYCAFIFFTYLYCTTYYGLPKVVSRAILVPTAHDEPPIYLTLFREIFTSPRVILYNTIEERSMVQGLFSNDNIPNLVVGLGIDPPKLPDVNGFRCKYGINEPYLLYVGRIEEAKGCDELLRWYLAGSDRWNPPFKLVMVGRATMPLPNHPRLIVTGFVSEEERWAALAGASVVIVPSMYDSLSMTLLEAWACGKPALVNGRCSVLKGHCLRSQAGLYYENEEEFVGGLRFLLWHPEKVRRMGENGQAYVQANYRWESVIAKYQQAIAWVQSSVQKG